MKKKIRFIINPISGGVKKAKVPQMIEAHLDHTLFDYDIAITQYKRHAKSIAEESAKEGIDIVCAVGGDGSVHEVGTALIGTKCHLAIIPTGSGNGLARHLKIPLKTPEAIKNINQLHSICMDTALANDKPFLGVGGYGFDAFIAKRFDEYHIRGFWGYTQLVYEEYFSYNPPKMKIELPDETIKGKFLLCSIANSSEFGNGFVISPKSTVVDGQMELVLLSKFAWWRTMGILSRFFMKKIEGSKFIR
ncbi:MAG: diacylglycerol kinase, partial [Fluviicola sp.]|nr:diacylglycerol kinase [Fluviicola sp.]